MVYVFKENILYCMMNKIQTHLMNCDIHSELDIMSSNIFLSSCIVYIWPSNMKPMVSCQKGPTRHAYAWQIGPFWQDTLEMFLYHLAKQCSAARHWGCSVILVRYMFISLWPNYKLTYIYNQSLLAASYRFMLYVCFGNLSYLCQMQQIMS